MSSRPESRPLRIRLHPPWRQSTQRPVPTTEYFHFLSTSRDLKKRRNGSLSVRRFLLGLRNDGQVRHRCGRKVVLVCKERRAHDLLRGREDTGGPLAEKSGIQVDRRADASQLPVRRKADGSAGVDADGRCSCVVQRGATSANERLYTDLNRCGHFERRAREECPKPEAPVITDSRWYCQLKLFEPCDATGCGGARCNEPPDLGAGPERSTSS